MDDALYLPTDQTLPIAQDYNALHAEGTTLIQALSSEIWTDYNEHDPGVTILEQACYALTELGYRAAFDMPDLLADSATGKISAERQALHPARRIMPANPTTPDDYRKLLIDRVRGIANAWVLPYRGAPVGKQIDGLYDILLYTPEAEQCLCEGEAGLKSQLEPYINGARAVYCQTRNLCEDLRSVTVLTPVSVEVRGVVTLQDDVPSDQVLAALLFSLGNLLAPEIRRHSLDEMRARGLATSAIFEGPLLRYGFIDSADLKPLATEIAYQDAIRALSRVPGVRTLRGIALKMAGGDWVNSGSIPIPANHIPRLETAVGASGFSLRLFRKGVECKPDPRRVAYELARLQSEWRKRYPLGPQYRQDYPFPTGAALPLTDYQPLQYGFPNVYGINANGLPENPPPLRSAQAKQLQGYLLMFDQVMADFFQQLDQAKRLFSIDQPDQTYFAQSLWPLLTNGEELLGPPEAYQQALTRLVRAGDDSLRRRNAFLDFLLALYGEAIEPSDLVSDSCDCHLSREAERRLLAAKTELLRRVVFCTRDRGRAFNYQARPGARNQSGLEVLARIQLGLPVSAHQSWSDSLDDGELNLNNVHIQSLLAALGDRQPALLRAIRQPGSLRIQPQADDGKGKKVGAALEWRDPGDGIWRIATRHDDIEAAERVLEELQALLRLLAARHQQFYVVEHLLLRYGRGLTADGAVPQGAEIGQGADFPYSFTLTIVQPRVSGSDQQAFQDRVRQVVRTDLAPYLAPRFLFLAGRDLHVFEDRYWDWRHALRSGDTRRIAVASARLRGFLQRHQT